MHRYTGFFMIRCRESADKIIEKEKMKNKIIIKWTSG